MALVGLLGLVGAAVRLYQLEDQLVQATALDDAERFSDALKEFRTLYTSEVVERARDHGVSITHDYRNYDNALPLPATLTMLLGTRLSEVEGGSVRLYSEYPFEGGQNTGLGMDTFEREALSRLQGDASEPVYRFEETDQGTVLRYATADIMREACVDCHNTHPLSPKTDWKVDDVRGVLALTRPMSERALQTRSDIQLTVWTLLMVGLLTLGVIGMAAIRVRRFRTTVTQLALDTREARRELVQESIERQKAQEERAEIESQALLTQKLESIGLLAGGIAHDFNNLLVSILGNAELAGFHVDPESPAHHHLDLLQQGGVRAANLTAQLLAYAGHRRLSTRVLDLNQTVRDIVQLLHTAVVRKARIDYELTADLPALEADPSQLEQVILNLLTNAADALVEAGAEADSENGNITIRTGIETVESPTRWKSVHGGPLSKGSYVFLEVEDRGCGMDEETRAKMFDPFYTTKQKGRGLGLAAMLGIVRAHHGAIHVHSVVNDGTTVRVMFPCSSESPEPVSAQAGRSAEHGDGRIVLVIDDDEDVRTTTVELLRARGFETLNAASGAAGLECLEANLSRVDAIVLDMSMPGMGGIETYEAMVALQPDVRVVMVSGFTEEARLEPLVSGGRLQFLSKPFSINELVEALLTSPARTQV